MNIINYHCKSLPKVNFYFYYIPYFLNKILTMNHKKALQLAAAALLFSIQQSSYAQSSVIPPSYHQISQEEEKNKTDTLKEVVVIGYGAQSKRHLSTAIASVRSDQIADIPAPDLTTALVGKLPGIQIAQTTGAPGEAINIKIRGVNTITAGSSPLFVVDGFPMDGSLTNTINKDDIESIDILKDAASAAIYGSRGSNGVVLITTKKGTAQTKIQYNAYYGIQQVSRIVPMMDAYQYADLVKDGRDNTYADRMRTVNEQRQAQSKSILSWNSHDDNPTRLRNTGGATDAIIPNEIFPYLQGLPGLTNTNWQKELFRNAPMTSHTISISGSQKKQFKYYASLHYFNQDGIVLNSGFERFSARVNIEAKKGILTYGAHINPSYTDRKYINTAGPGNRANPADAGIIGSALYYAPIFPVYTPDNTYSFAQNNWSSGATTAYTDLDGQQKTARGNGQTQYWNPVALAMLQKNSAISKRLLGTVYAAVDIFKNITGRSSFGVDYGDTRVQEFISSTIPLSANATNDEGVAQGKSATNSYVNWLWENTLTYNHTINRHHINALLGWTVQKYHQYNTQVTGTMFPSNTITTLNQAAQILGSSDESAWSLLSGLMRIQYHYQNKYLLSGALRTDGSSRFGTQNKWGIFPSVSAGWNIDRENFMSALKPVVQQLKIRASYGITGNFNIGNYAAQGELVNNMYTLADGSQVSGVAAKANPNPNLSWERTLQTNIGVDIALFHNQLYFTFNWYNAQTQDMLFNVPVPISTGFISELRNIGKVRNRGIELLIGTEHKVRDFHYNISLNISVNRNKVIDLGSVTQFISSGSIGNAFYMTQVGQPISTFFLPVVLGVFHNQEEVDKNVHYKDAPNNYNLATTQPGDFHFKDVNGDGVLDLSGADREIVGSYFPEFTGGFNATLEYKGLGFSIVCNGTYGNKVFNLARRYYYNKEGNMNSYIGGLNRWRSPENTGSGTDVRANRTAKGLNGITSSWHLEDGSFLRIQNITLSYSLPERWIKKIHMDKLRLYFSIQNLHTFTKYIGYNPEVSNRDNTTTFGEDYGVYPLARTFTIGLNVIF